MWSLVSFPWSVFRQFFPRVSCRSVGRAFLTWFSVGLMAGGQASGMKSEVNDGGER